MGVSVPTFDFQVIYDMMNTDIKLVFKYRVSGRCETSEKNNNKHLTLAQDFLNIPKRYDVYDTRFGVYADLDIS